jgi:hypothetical protein
MEQTKPTEKIPGAIQVVEVGEMTVMLVGAGAVENAPLPAAVRS